MYLTLLALGVMVTDLGDWLSPSVTAALWEDVITKQPTQDDTTSHSVQLIMPSYPIPEFRAL